MDDPFLASYEDKRQVNNPEECTCSWVIKGLSNHAEGRLEGWMSKQSTKSISRGQEMAQAVQEWTP